MTNISLIEMMRRILPLVLASLSAFLPANVRAGYIYRVTEASDFISYVTHSSSYGDGTAVVDSAVTYNLDVATDYSSATFRDIMLTSTPATFESTAAFPVGIGLPLATISTQVTFKLSVDVYGYTPQASIYAGVGGYRLQDGNGNLYSSLYNYTGSYLVRGPTEQKSGNFNYSFHGGVWSSLPHDRLSFTSSNDPVLTFSGSGPAYQLHFDRLAFHFYNQGGAPAPLFSETVDNVPISFTPKEFIFSGWPSVTVSPIPETQTSGIAISSLLILLLIQRRTNFLGFARDKLAVHRQISRK